MMLKRIAVAKPIVRIIAVMNFQHGFVTSSQRMTPSTKIMRQSGPTVSDASKIDMAFSSEMPAIAFCTSFTPS